MQNNPTSQLISADSHINEPPDLWTSRAAGRLKGLVPEVVPTAAGDAWVVTPNGKKRPIWSSAAAGIKPEDYQKKPMTYKAMRPGSFDPAARLEDMDIDGISAEVLYPGIGRALDTFYDADVRLRCAQIYNDWIAEFQAHAPSRLVGLAILPPIDDGENARQELERAAKLGLRGAFLALPVDGLPLSHPRAESLWECASTHGIPISLHIGSGRSMWSLASSDAAAAAPGIREADMAPIPMQISGPIASLIFGGVFDRHRKLRVVVAESGIGWIPWFIERMESLYQRFARHGDITATKRSPAELWAEHMSATFQEEVSGLRLRHMIGVGNIMWASDYPHTQTTWPESKSVVKSYFADVSPEETAKITVGNCAELYGLNYK